MGNFGGGKNLQIWQTISHSPKFSLPIDTDTPRVYALTVAFLTNSFYLYGSPKFSSHCYKAKFQRRLDIHINMIHNTKIGTDGIEWDIRKYMQLK